MGGDFVLHNKFTFIYLYHPSKKLRYNALVAHGILEGHTGIKS